MKIEFLETIKVLDGSLCHIEYHQRRYERTLASFGVRDFLRLDKVLAPPQDGLYRCRFLYTTEGAFTKSYHRYKKRDIQKLKVIPSDTLEYDKKYANRDALESLFEQREGCDDIIIVKNGLLQDTTIANIALFNGRDWLTPNKPLLKGTTRERLLQSGFLKTADIRAKDLKKFQKMALMNAMIDFDIIAENKSLEDIIC